MFFLLAEKKTISSNTVIDNPNKIEIKIIYPSERSNSYNKRSTLTTLLFKPKRIKDLVKDQINKNSSKIKINFGNLQKRNFESNSFWGHSDKLTKIF